MILSKISVSCKQLLYDRKQVWQRACDLLYSEVSAKKSSFDAEKEITIIASYEEGSNVRS